MNLTFYKYQATGNDFILVDNRKGTLGFSDATIAFLCNRHTGIGADGMILLSAIPGFDFFMTYFNSDGKESTMCGNGGRCITAFAARLDLIKDKAHFKAIDGIHYAEILTIHNSSTLVRLKMKEVDYIYKSGDAFVLNTGSPHWVAFAENVAGLDMIAEGRKIRYGKDFAPDGTNVNYAEINPTSLFVRTYERGVENETLSCGTGATASALAYSTAYGKSSPVMIHTKGGKLKVSFTKKSDQFRDIWLEGDASFVFKGEINI